MDVSGIWRYFGNYSFFGAPFIWTTLHDFGGNDGLKGDFGLLSGMPGDALAAGASIIGTGTTMEGINQNPAYYEYTYDTGWHETAQPLEGWFKGYAGRRYGIVENADAEAAWEILRTTVYNYAGCGSFGGYHDGTGVEWKVWGAPPTCGLPTPSNVSKAWALLVKTGEAVDPTAYQTLNYDIVNTGREVRAQLITVFEASLTAAVKAVDRPSAMKVGATLLAAYSDLDELVGCDSSFLIGTWIADAKKWANASDAPARFYEWQAKSQVATWWPVAPSDVAEWTANYTKGPPLDGYANKHWNGLIRDFYRERVQCYVDQIAVDLPAKSTLNTPNLTKCAVEAEMAFTQSTATKYSETPTSSKTLALSQALLKKYASYL
jgi:alpha-N-acetylglucosaminidase